MKKLKVLFIVLIVMLLAPAALHAQIGSPARLVPAPVHKVSLWSHSGGGLTELTTVHTTVEEGRATETGSDRPFQWSHSGGGMTELRSVLAPTSDHKVSLWSHSGGGLTELTTIHTTVTAVNE